MKWRVPIKRKRAVTAWPSFDGVFIASTRAKCEEALRMFRDEPVVGVDTETYGCDPRNEHPKGKAKVLSIQFAAENTPAIFVPMWGKLGPSERVGNLDVFAEWLEDSRKQKVLHNAKYDMHSLMNHGIRMRGVLGDTMVMDYLHANGEDFHGLKECCRRYFNDDSAKDYGDVFRENRPLKKKGPEGETLYGKATFVPSLLDVVRKHEGVEKLVNYAVKDPVFTVRLYQYLGQKMRATNWRDGTYFDYYEKFELPFLDVLFDMEREGCRVDLEFLKAMSQKMGEDAVKAESDFLAEAANMGVESEYLEKFSITSPKQVAELLFGKLGIAASKRTPGGDVSTSTGALEEIKGDGKKLAKLVLAHRRLMKLKGTYVDRFIEQAPEYDGYMHTNMKQIGTATGRLSSSAPNLQNIVTKSKDPYGVRKAFIPPDGYDVADIDLEQVEVRITAHVSKDPTMLRLVREGKDLHLQTMIFMFPEVTRITNGREPTKELAKEVAEKLGKDRWEDLRRKAKIANFGVIYGMGPQGYAAQVGCSEKEAINSIDLYFAGYPGLREGIKRIRQGCARDGFIRTLLGRYVVVPDIRSREMWRRSAAERQAFNYCIQGSCADLLKMGMIACHQNEILQNEGVKMILQIHDELVFIVPKGANKKVVKAVIEDCVARPYGWFGVKPMVVDTPADLGFGANWNDAKV